VTFYRRRLPHLQRDGKPHFVTFCTLQRWHLPENEYRWLWYREPENPYRPGKLA